MAAATRQAADWWQDRAMHWLREGPYHILTEVAFRDPGKVIRDANDFHDGGYRVRITAMGVPAALSRLAVIERYTEQREVTGTGRWTKSHDLDYDATPQVVHLAEESPAVQQVTILAREGVVWDRSNDISWQQGIAGSAVDALKGAREPSFNRAQVTAINNTLSELIDRLEHLGPVPLEVTEMASQIVEELAALDPRPADPAQHLTEAMRHLREANATLLSQTYELGTEPPATPPLGPDVV